MFCHDMFAVEVVEYLLIDIRNLIEVILGLLTFPFRDVWDTHERALSPHHNFVRGHTAFSNSIMQV
jgi:hypothetical protein